MNALIASMIFFPTREYEALPEDYGLKAEDAWFETKDGARLHGWFFSAADAKTALLFLHGNATNISGVLPYAKAWTENGISALLADYRSYGESGSSIRSGKDIFLDAEGAVAWLCGKKGFEENRIVLYGQSIGAAAAIHLAAETRLPPAGKRFRAIVLEGAFASLKEMAKLHYGFQFGFFLSDFSYENEKKIAEVSSPVFILHGTRDEICPVSMGNQLFEAARKPKEFLWVEGAGHNDLLEVGGEAVFSRPIQFVKQFE